MPTQRANEGVATHHYCPPLLGLGYRNTRTWPERFVERNVRAKVIQRHEVVRMSE